MLGIWCPDSFVSFLGSLKDGGVLRTVLKVMMAKYCRLL